MERCPFVATCRRNLRLVVAVADGPHSRSCFPGHLLASANAGTAVRVSAGREQQRSELALHAITPLRLR